MKTPLLKVALSFLLLLPLLGRAQEVRINGRVVDAKTKQPVPFASLGLRDTDIGALSNEDGYFQLLKPGVFKQDSLVVMTLGYVRKALFVEPGKAENLRVALTPWPAGFISHHTSGPCRVASSPKSAKNDPAITQNDIVIDGISGAQFAFFIENDKRRQLRTMRSVSFYIGENGFPIVPYRIHIYRADGKQYSPGTDLLNERVVIAATKGSQWYTYDLTRYSVATPTEGYFVALEFEKPGGSSPQPDMDNYMPFGRIMRPTFEFKKSITWSYFQEIGWSVLPVFKSSRRYNAMVKVEVEGVK